MTIAVTSGVLVQGTREVMLAQFRVHLRAYTALFGGTALFDKPITQSFSFTDVRDPAAGVVQDLPTDYIGRLVRDTAGVEFILSEKRNALSFDLVDADGLGRTPAAADSTPITNGNVQVDGMYRVLGLTSLVYNGITYMTNQHFVGVQGVGSWSDAVGSGSVVAVGVINGTRRSRNIFRSQYFNQDYRLTRMVVQADVVVGSPTLVWYQAPGTYQSFVVPAGNGGTSFMDTDLIISQDRGARALNVDLWDPTVPDQIAPQLSGLTGLITFYALPYEASVGTVS